ncbi:hypothetical protein BD311DRAFT_766638 [Dichomitus squalens]|uniref:Uncharacterized protein n=1 Tax=Dichomitus squalens TaxID=114155 RepID=A0A4Q9MEY6_9APHY|nr:hypothetical protein BD311DRAFT_766638 [Dichomitus squalens]
MTLPTLPFSEDGSEGEELHLAFLACQDKEGRLLALILRRPRSPPSNSESIMHVGFCLPFQAQFRLSRPNLMASEIGDRYYRLAVLSQEQISACRTRILADRKVYQELSHDSSLYLMRPKEVVNITLSRWCPTLLTKNGYRIEPSLAAGRSNKFLLHCGQDVIEIDFGYCTDCDTSSQGYLRARIHPTAPSPPETSCRKTHVSNWECCDGMAWTAFKLPPKSSASRHLRLTLSLENPGRPSERSYVLDVEVLHLDPGADICPIPDTLAPQSNLMSDTPSPSAQSDQSQSTQLVRSAPDVPGIPHALYRKRDSSHNSTFERASGSTLYNAQGEYSADYSQSTLQRPRMNTNTHRAVAFDDLQMNTELYQRRPQPAMPVPSRQFTTAGTGILSTYNAAGTAEQTSPPGRQGSQAPTVRTPQRHRLQTTTYVQPGKGFHRSNDLSAVHPTSHYLNDGRGAWQAPTSHVGEHRAIQHGAIYQAEAHRQDHDGPYANLNMMRTHSPSPIGSQANSYHPHPEEVATRPAYSYRSPPEARQEPNGFPADVVAPQIALHGRTGQPTGYPSAFGQDENMEAERTLTQRPPLPASAASHAAGRAVPPAPALAPGAEPAPPSLSSAGPVVAESPGATSTSQPAAQGLNADPTANAPAETKKRKKRFLPRIEFKLRLVRD